MHDTVTRDATLRDALEAVLTDNAGRVAVTGRRGEYTGVVDMETLMNSVHELLEADRLEAMEHRHELQEQRARRRTPSRRARRGRRRREDRLRGAAARGRARGQGGWPSGTRASGSVRASATAGRLRRARAAERRRAADLAEADVPAGVRSSLVLLAHLAVVRSRPTWTRSPGTPCRTGRCRKALRQHIELTAISTFFVLIIAIPLGIALTRRVLRRAHAGRDGVRQHRARPTPALGLLALLVIWLGIGQRPRWSASSSTPCCRCCPTPSPA